MSGTMGKYLIVNLSDRSSQVVNVEDSTYRKYLTGYGLGAAVITERQAPGIDPLSPESYLGFCSGLLTGTGAMFSGRYMVVGKSPLTGGWGDANAGGSLSVAIKKAGYDAVFVTGASSSPIYVFVNDREVTFRDAAHLWGMDAIQTEQALKTTLSKAVEVAAIGVGGEKLSLISGIVTDGGRMAARSGLGAVMGSKNLKALAVSGKQKIPVARERDFIVLTKEYMAEYNQDPGSVSRFMAGNMKHLARLNNILMRFNIDMGSGEDEFSTAGMLKEAYRRYGTPMSTTTSVVMNDASIRNWSRGGTNDFSIASAEKLGGHALSERHLSDYHCQACPLGCGKHINLPDSASASSKGHQPEFETLAAFGSNLLHDNLDAVIQVNDMCNRAGMDTISTGGAVAFAFECFENGLIDLKMTGGLKLKWGDSEVIIKLTEMIIHREGIGDLLADGVQRAAERIGNSAHEFAMHVGGQELPQHDPRVDTGFALAYQHEPTPARHTISSSRSATLYSSKKLFPGEYQALIERTGQLSETNHAARYALGSLHMQLLNGAGICQFAALTSIYPIVDYLNAATGWDLTPGEYLRTGERILSLRKAFNVREGLLPGSTRLPDRVMGIPPFTKGPIKGVTVDIEQTVEEFYAIMGWDTSTGGPTGETLRDLEIDHLFPEYPVYQ